MRSYQQIMLDWVEALSEEQKARWLPGICSGELMTAIAMTEPGMGSDLAAMRTTAVRQGDHYLLNGKRGLPPLPKARAGK